MAVTGTSRIAVVTGAARGMGQAVAANFAHEGFRVAGIDILDLGETASLVRSAGADWLGINADLTSPCAVDQARDSVTESFGPANILVNVAGILPSLSWDNTDLDIWKRVQSVNLDTQFLTCKAFVPAMRSANWGRIINFASCIVSTHVPDYAAYRTSKASIIGFTRSLAIDLGSYGITANAVSPSFVVTGGTVQDAHQQDFITQSQCIKRAATSQDIVGLISFLAGDKAEFITGQMIHADGGLVFR